MRKKNQIISFIVLLLTSTICINAQITIGKDSRPVDGAILQLKETDAGGVNSNKGLGMPRVRLTALNDLSPTIDTHVPGALDEWHVGLTIYNTITGGDDTNGYFCPGLYVWIGRKWQKVGDNCPKPPVIIAQPADFTHIVMIDDPYADLTVTAVGENLNYTWKDDEGNVVSTGAPNFKPAKTYGYKEYTCTVSNEGGQTTSAKAQVLFGCGARTVTGGWIVLRCHNLGADESLSPFEDNPGIYGDFYQWGRTADGHEKRNSETTLVRPTTITPNHSKFIIVKDPPYEWLDAPDITPRWGDGTLNANQSKGVNDPCPVGWKIPTQDQWDSIFNGDSSDETDPASATANTWVQVNGRGYKVGIALYFSTYGGSGRTATGGVVVNPTLDWGSYWASNAITQPDHRAHFFMAGSMIQPRGTTREAIGLLVRCTLDN